MAGGDIVGYIAGDIVGDELGDDVGDIVGADHDLAALMSMGASHRRRGAHAQRPGRHIEVEGSEFTKMREFVLGMNLPGGPTAQIAGGASGTISATLQKKMRVERFVVPSSIAQGYLITALLVGVNPQISAVGAIPAETFSPNGVGVRLHGDTGDPGISVSMSLLNISGGPLFAFASCIGTVAQ